MLRSAAARCRVAPAARAAALRRRGIRSTAAPPHAGGGQAAPAYHQHEYPQQWHQQQHAAHQQHAYEQHAQYWQHQQAAHQQHPYGLHGGHPHGPSVVPPPPPPPPPPLYTYTYPYPAAAAGAAAPPAVLTLPPPTRAERLLRAVNLLGMLLGAGASAMFFYIMISNIRAMGSMEMDGRGPGGPGGPLGKLIGEVKAVEPGDIDARFADVLGCDEAKAELEEVVCFLKDPKRFEAVGGRLPKGVLLAGPPGTGKTLLARAVAAEAGVPFFYASGSEFEEVFVGIGARRVRELFAAARKEAGERGAALVFIDEIDAIGGARSDGAEANAGGRATLNQLLTEMDGFKGGEGVFVLAATNTPRGIDKALLRPGRFDATVAVDPPDARGREQILARYLRDVRQAPGCPPPADLARMLPGTTGAELRNVVNIAAIAAAKRGAGAVSAADLEHARDKVQLGAERRSYVVPEAERRVTAWHEAGHALVALLTDGADPVHKATIVPRGQGVAGLVLQLPADDRLSVTRRQMGARLRVALGGRAAEEELGGEDGVTGGASSDYQQATQLAKAMVRQLGMADGAVGAVDWSSSRDAEGAYLSDATKAALERETRRLVDDALSDARGILHRHRPLLDAIAEQLLAKSTLTGAELAALADEHGAPRPAAGGPHPA